MPKLLLLLTLLLAATPQTQAAWLVDAQSGCRLWSAEPPPNIAVTWSGGCAADGTATGSGVQETRIGDTVYRYDGEYRDGKRHGRGVLLWPNGDRYDGEWRDDRRNGSGVLTWKRGDRYEGEWKDDSRFGQGVMVWRAGHRYQGQFSNDTLNGLGKFVARSGDRYDGQFRDGLPDGRGEAVLAQNRYSGTWVAGCFDENQRRVAFLKPLTDCR